MMNGAFEQGVRFVADNMGAALGGLISDQWISETAKVFDSQTEHLIDELNAFVQGKKTPLNKFQGNVFEKWHAETFNVHAKIHKSSATAKVLGSNKKNSVDVLLKKANGKKVKYGMKSYKDAKGSLKAQAKFGKDSRASAYVHQIKVIPADQLKAARSLVKDLINKYSKEGKIDTVERLKEVQKTLTDRLNDHKGCKSIPISREKIEALTKELREGKVDKELLKKYNIDLKHFISPKDILGQSFKAGLSAAVISLVLSITPTICNGISMLINEGEIDTELFIELGEKGLSGSAKGFIHGSLSAAIVACCNSGRLGASLIGVNPTNVATAVVLVTNTVYSALKFATGKISKAEMADEIMQLHFATFFANIGGAIMSAFLPQLSVISYMMGSFIGGIIGGYVYNITKDLFMSFCVVSGCTFFGLVNQSYELPKEIAEEIGIEVFDYEKFEYDTFQYDSFQLDTFRFDNFEYDRFGIKILRRGVLEIGKIGYM